MKYIREDFFFRNTKVRIIVFRVRADMDNSIHIQIKVVKFRDLQYIKVFTAISLTRKIHIYGNRKRNMGSILHVYKFGRVNPMTYKCSLASKIHYSYFLMQFSVQYFSMLDIDFTNAVLIVCVCLFGDFQHFRPV